MLITDAKLTTAPELRERLQSIHRQQSQEQGKSPTDRRGYATPALMARHVARLQKLEARADAIKARLRAMGVPIYA